MVRVHVNICQELFALLPPTTDTTLTNTDTTNQHVYSCQPLEMSSSLVAKTWMLAENEHILLGGSHTKSTVLKH